MVSNTIIVCALILSIFLLSAESASLYGVKKNNTISYRRYIRRRPSRQYNGDYYDEVLEIYHTKERKPSTVNIMTDEEVDKFIFCDFNRELDECKIYWESRNSKKPTATTTKTPKVEIFTKMKGTTKTPAVVIDTTTAHDEPTTTEISNTSSSTEFLLDLPRIPDIEVELDDDYPNTLKDEVETIDNDNEDNNNDNDYVEEDADEDEMENDYVNNDDENEK